MKKIIAIILISMLSPLGVLAQAGDCVKTDRISMLKNTAPIEDELLRSDAFPKIIPEYIKQNDPITDELAETYVKSGNTIKLWAYKKGDYQKVNINDDWVTSPGFIAKFGKLSAFKNRHKEVIEDSFAKNNLKNTDKKISVKNKYDFTKIQIPVRMKIAANVSTRKKITEGDSILFKTLEDVKISEKTLPKGTTIVGRIETISESDKMGTPANLIIDNFYVQDNPNICFYGNITKTGANRSLWVYPLYQAGNIMFYVAGFVFVPIHGGHAKISTNETYTVFYETH